MKPGFLDNLRAVWSRRETIRYLVSSHLESGHRDKVLGHLWNLLDPLLFMLVYFFVFGMLFGQTGRARPLDFMLYIFVGQLAWRYFSASVSQAANCIRANRGLINELYFPKAVFPVSICVARLYDFFWGMLVLLVALVTIGPGISWHILWFPLLVAGHALFTLGSSLLIAFSGAFFADTVNISNAALRLWFYVSPLFYRVRGEGSLIEDGSTMQKIYMLNPVACIFESYRDALLWHRAPDPVYVGWFWLVGVVVAIVGFAVFTSAEGKYSKHV